MQSLRGQQSKGSRCSVKVVVAGNYYILVQLLFIEAGPTRLFQALFDQYAVYANKIGDNAKCK